MEITSFKLSQDKQTLLLELQDAGTVTGLHLWTEETYKIEEYKIDLSTKLNGQFSQFISITPQDLGIPYFDGVYFIYASSATVTSECAIAADLTRYKECILDKIMAYKGCDSCMEAEYIEVLNAQSNLYAIEAIAIPLNLIQETLTLIYSLDKFCKDECNSCGKYKKS